MRQPQYPFAAIARSAAKQYEDRQSPAPPPDNASLPLKPTSADDMRRILLSALKILVSAALLYFALRKIDFLDLASRFDVASLGWMGLAIAVMFLQILVGA